MKLEFITIIAPFYSAPPCVRYGKDCHTPPPGLAFGEPDDRLQRGIQYALSVIASQRVGAKRRPMTGSAKQSIAPQGSKLDCFVALLLATTWRGRDSVSRSRRALRPSFALIP